MLSVCFGPFCGLKSNICRGPRMGWTGRAPAPNGSQSAPGACQERSTTMPRTTTLHAVTAIGIDMGKNTLHLIGLDARGAIVLREKVARGRIALRLANLPSCLIGIEAGMATHYVARELAALGHDVKQVPATYAKPFRQGHKNIEGSGQNVRMDPAGTRAQL